MPDLPTPNDVTVTVSTEQKPAIRDLIVNLTGILTGRVTDVAGIALGFKSRLGYAVLSLIAPNFDELGRGQQGANSEVWPPLSKEYLAYGRRFGPTEQSDLKKAYGLGKAHRHAPGNKKGLLTLDQLKQWRRTYADRLAWYIMKLPDAKAKEVAARIAWSVVKKAGAKTKLEVFGNRQVQILVDTGRGRGSLQPGIVYESGPSGNYQKPSGKGGTDQTFELEPSGVTVGTNVKYMGAHHKDKEAGVKKGPPTRRLWPREFPSDWWNQILGVGIQGLTRIAELYNSNRIS